MVLSYRPSAPVISLPAHRPADRVEQAGRHRLTCLPLPCKAEACGFSSSLSCGVSLPAWRAVPFLSKDFPRQSFKTFLGNVLKTFPDNLLETAKHTPSYMSRPAFLRLRRSVSPPIVSLFSLVCDLSLLKRRVFQIASRLAPRPVMPSCPPSATYPHQAVLFLLIAIRLGSPRFSPIEPHPPTPRPTDTQDGEKNGTAAWMVRVI